MFSLTLASASTYYYTEYYYHVELSKDYFTKYRISQKINIDDDHFLVELIPLRPQRTNLWATYGGSKLWSIEIKQPDIMVVRSYTPLPLKIKQNGEVDVFCDDDHKDGTLALYIKKYRNGEVARWIDRLKMNQVLELRGPYVEYEFPSGNDEIERSRDFLWSNSTPQTQQETFKYQPFDISFFTAGTGIVTPLQITLTQSPFTGKVKLFHACKNINELGPLYNILQKLNQNDRINLHLYETNKSNQFRNNPKSILKNIDEPFKYNGLGPFYGLKKQIEPVFCMVCGPDGFISTVAGTKYDLSQGSVEGLLKLRGWDNNNVYKL